MSSFPLFYFFIPFVSLHAFLCALHFPFFFLELCFLPFFLLPSISFLALYFMCCASLFIFFLPEPFPSFFLPALFTSLMFSFQTFFSFLSLLIHVSILPSVFLLSSFILFPSFMLSALPSVSFHPALFLHAFLHALHFFSSFLNFVS